MLVIEASKDILEETCMRRKREARKQIKRREFGRSVDSSVCGVLTSH